MLGLDDELAVVRGGCFSRSRCGVPRRASASFSALDDARIAAPHRPSPHDHRGRRASGARRTARRASAAPALSRGVKRGGVERRPLGSHSGARPAALWRRVGNRTVERFDSQRAAVIGEHDVAERDADVLDDTVAVRVCGVEMHSGNGSASALVPFDLDDRLARQRILLQRAGGIGAISRPR